MTNINEAISCARRGWNVIPLTWPGFTADWCKSPGKQPLVRDWPNEATRDEAKIKRWFQRWPKANLGVKTGAVSGLVVLDVDPKNGGRESLEGLVGGYGPLPDTVEVLTGGGGRHIYFKYPAGQKVPDKVNLAPGLDIRGDGGQVVAPPSVHSSGRRYEWEASSEPDSTPLAEMPGWLLALIHRPQINNRPTALQENEPIAEGARNDTLTRIAGMFRRQGLSANEISTALQPINQKRCIPPLTDDELMTIARSMARYKPEPITATDWPVPVPLTDYELPSYPLESLPSWLRDYVTALAEATQTPPDMAGVLVLPVLAAAVAKKAVIQAGDGWTEPLNIYAVVALPPASRKTAVFSALTEPIEAYERELIAQMRPEVEKARNGRATLEQALAMARQNAAKEKAGGGSGGRKRERPF